MSLELNEGGTPKGVIEPFTAVTASYGPPELVKRFVSKATHACLWMCGPFGLPSWKLMRQVVCSKVKVRGRCTWVCKTGFEGGARSRGIGQRSQYRSISGTWFGIVVRPSPAYDPG